ncbi:MAG: hypothetical protein RL477_161 [Pseudomonadota bacterium]|jgi:alanine racemase
MSRSEPSPGQASGGSAGAGGVLTIDLGAIAANWKLLSGRLAPGAVCGAVVKADAYGLGLAPVARALFAAGCRTFFVALPGEGVALRRILPDAEICVFNGVDAGSAADLAAAGLTPVLNHLGQVEDWRQAAGRVGRALPAWLHVDTGMTRLGFDESEVAVLADDPGRLSAIALRGVMSHLACADQPDHPLNGEQRGSFDAALARLGTPLARPETGLARLGTGLARAEPGLARAETSPGVRRSLANSSAIFLGADFHYDLARPGAALYGVAPLADAPNPMAQVVALKGKILQTRRIDTPRSVGYGATHRAERGRIIATVAVGYADGYLRSLSGTARAHVGQNSVRVIGRVSMDLLTIDVTDVPENAARPGAFVDLIGPHHTVDELAREAGTIGYEILTSLGQRFTRHYVGEGA